MSITSINHFSFTVSSLDNSIKFYRDILGLNLLDRSGRDPEFSQKVTGLKDVELDIAYFEGFNARIELIEYIRPLKKIFIDTKTSHVGSAHICFNINAFESFVAKLHKANVEFLGEVCKIPAGPNRGKGVLYFNDPDKNTIEVISNEII